jgi:hypothetical protein
MKVCSEGHREIVYEDIDESDFIAFCPLCDAEAKIFNLEKHIEELCKKLGYKKT